MKQALKLNADRINQDDALLADYALGQRPSLPHVDRRLAERGHEIGHLFDLVPLRHLSKSSPVDARLGVLLGIVQCRLYHRLLEAGHSRHPLYVAEYPPVCGGQ